MGILEFKHPLGYRCVLAQRVFYLMALGDNHILPSSLMGEAVGFQSFRMRAF